MNITLLHGVNDSMFVFTSYIEMHCISETVSATSVSITTVYSCYGPYIMCLK